jgi:hypothetical protein
MIQIFLEKLIVAQLVNKYPDFFGTQYRRPISVTVRVTGPNTGQLGYENL